MATVLLGRDHLEVVHALTADAAAAPLIAGLLAELTARAGTDALPEFDERHRALFAPPLGGELLVLTQDGETLAGGAFRRYDPGTVQLDWLWTRPDRRRRGLGRRVVAELEYTATWRGYQRAYAVAGPGAPEVRQLLAAYGYTPLGSPSADLEYLGFVKQLNQLG